MMTTIPATESKTHKRRKPPRKNAIVLAAAEQAFVEYGYAGTSVDEIAERAGVSKRTVYSNFETKEALYNEVVRKLCADVVPHEIDPQLLTGDPEKTLLRVSIAFLEALYQPRQVAFYQTVVADSRQFPDAGKMLFDGPIARTQLVFDHYFRKQVQRGVMEFRNVELAAAQFVAILKTNLHMCLMLSQPALISHRELEEIARSSLQVFLYGAIKRTGGRTKAAAKKRAP